MEIKKFNQMNEKSESSNTKDQVRDYIGKNKKNKSSYEMYKELRDKGFKETDLKDYFYDSF